MKPIVYQFMPDQTFAAVSSAYRKVQQGSMIGLEIMLRNDRNVIFWFDSESDFESAMNRITHAARGPVKDL